MCGRNGGVTRSGRDEEDSTAISGVAFGIVELGDGESFGGLDDLRGKGGRDWRAVTESSKCVLAIIKIIATGAGTVFFGVPENANTGDAIWIFGL